MGILRTSLYFALRVSVGRSRHPASRGTRASLHVALLRCSNLLPANLVEPPSKAWEALVLPLNHTRGMPVGARPCAGRRHRQYNEDLIVIHFRFLSAPPMPVRITLNGEEQRLETALTVAQLLESLGLTGQRVAVEVNREIVPRSRHADAKLQDNDRVEVVRAIGGG